MRPGEEGEIAALIHRSTNAWYGKKFGIAIFPGPPEDCRIFPETYEALDPGCCLVAEVDGKLAGSCFYHPRETHVGLGIMNASPDFAGRGVARALLADILRRAGDLPVRLVSSALNLDSYSLYTRAGFVPVALYQDMVLPADRPLPSAPETGGTLREARAEDLAAMVALEREISGICREKDCAHFLANPGGYWKTFAHFDATGEMDGWLASVDHPGSRLVGPGVARDEAVALGLIHSQLSAPRGGTPVFLVPAAAKDLVAALYEWGTRNVELHVLQVCGAFTPPKGIVMPTFLPESG